MLALTHARLIDGTGAPPCDDVTVVVAAGRVASIGEPPPAEAQVIDLAGRRLLPGLIDAHVHLSGLGLPQPELQTRDLAPDMQAYGLTLVSRHMLEGGLTTVRDCGSYGRSLFTLRRAIELGLCAGPRLVLCGQIVAATSPGARAFAGMYREADGPDDMRKAVREQIRQGADFIKIMATGALTVPDEDINPAQMTLEELQAIVEEAHRMGFKVASHAEGLDGIRLSVEAGVDTIEHGDMGYRDPAVLEAMAAKGIVLVPTLCVFEAVANASGRFPQWMLDQAKMLGEAALKTVEAAHRAGVPIAMGADAGPHGANARELVKLVEAGLTPMEGIVAATSIAAKACGIEKEVGTVAPGQTADLLILDGDPLEDVQVFTRPEQRWLVIQNGKPVAGAALAPTLTLPRAATAAAQGRGDSLPSPVAEKRATGEGPGMGA
ncbi:MAG: amidohydrolase family protein [Anaerolineales bacterium]